MPIYIGATGMQMMELAGEIADGVVLNYLVSPIYNDMAMDHLERGAHRAGRSATDLDRPQLVVCSLDEDRAAALDAARLLVTQYLGQQPHIMKASGVPESLLEEIGKVLTWPATAEQVEVRLQARARRHRADDHGIGHRRGVPGQGGRVREQRVHLPGALPARLDVHAMIDAFSGLDRLTAWSSSPASTRAAPRAAPPARVPEPGPRAGRPASAGRRAARPRRRRLDLDRLHAGREGEVPRVDRLVAPADPICGHLGNECGAAFQPRPGGRPAQAVTSSSRCRT